MSATILFNPGRQQPYIVWNGPYVEFFTASYADAEQKVRRLNERKAA